MSAKYLLPCRCGQQAIVEPRQAGETILCSCGAPLQVPTLLDMSNLELAPPESAPAAPPATWGTQHRLRLVGIVLVLIALAGSVLLYLNPPRSQFDILDPEKIRQSCQKMSPSETWKTWEYFKQGLDPRTDEKYADDMRTYHLWQIVDATIGLLGAALIVAGTVGARSKRLGISD